MGRLTPPDQRNQGQKTEDFDFDLPRDRIATAPARPRDSARMLEVGKQLSDRTVRELPSLLGAGDVLVLNDTRVIPARLHGLLRGARVEVTLIRQGSGANWQALARPARKLAPGDIIVFAGDFRATVAGTGERGEVTLSFDSPREVLPALERYGELPLPPYIRRPKGPTAEDAVDYQTVYSARPGAVASPTAGLHLTDTLLQQIRECGVEIATITLHIGPGTFLPVRTEDIRSHRMHGEWGEITPSTAAMLNAARDKGGRVISVGTTCLRLIESAASVDGTVQPFNNETDLFITPGYRFRAVDTLMTNFHLPRSTLFMLVSAFSGLDRMKTAYEHAIAANYRFYSYGDACFLHRADTL